MGHSIGEIPCTLDCVAGEGELGWHECSRYRLLQKAYEGNFGFGSSQGIGYPTQCTYLHWGRSECHCSDITTKNGFTHNFISELMLNPLTNQARHGLEK